METEIAALTIGGISLVSLTGLVTQFIKSQWELEGRSAQVLALGVSALHTAIAVGVRDGYDPDTFLTETVPFWYAASWLVGLASMGAYKLVSQNEREG